jgi:hypothetical protein
MKTELKLHPVQHTPDSLGGTCQRYEALRQTGGSICKKIRNNKELMQCKTDIINIHILIIRDIYS